MPVEGPPPEARATGVWRRDGFTISTHPDRIDRDLTVSFLAASYWARGIPRELLLRSIDNALVFGLYDTDGGQVGFARVVTDYARFAWLSDVFVLDAYRGRGLGKWLIEVVTTFPPIRDLRMFLLATADAHALYERFGFAVPDEPGQFMRKQNP